jgi:NitT/TauT family transport system substrate-binding protein
MFLIGLLVVPSAHSENIKIGLPSVTITAMPFFVARDHGFFQQEGLNAEMVVMPAALNIKVLLAGEIQYAATIGSAVAASIRGINVRTVMLFVDRPLLDLVGGPGINSIGDLKGKVVALSSRGGLQDIVMRRMLTQSKVDHNQVTMITIAGQTALITATKTGNVAAALLNPPFNFIAYREGLNHLGFSGKFRAPAKYGSGDFGGNAGTFAGTSAPPNPRSRACPSLRKREQSQGDADAQARAAPR